MSVNSVIGICLSSLKALKATPLWSYHYTKAVVGELYLDVAVCLTPARHPYAFEPVHRSTVAGRRALRRGLPGHPPPPNRAARGDAPSSVPWQTCPRLPIPR